MGISLQKGQNIKLGLTKMSIGLGWDPKQGTGPEFDLDASAFMIDKKGMIPGEGYFVFYGNTTSPDQALNHSGDDPTGGNSATGDDEIIQVDLTQVSENIEQVLFVVTIHDAYNRRQNFGQVRNSYIRIVDDLSGQEVAKYELGEDFSIETAIEFGRLYKHNGGWKFEASGIGHKQDLAYFLARHYNGEITK
jgi:tellurium resistance protein TerD